MNKSFAHLHAETYSHHHHVTPFEWKENWKFTNQTWNGRKKESRRKKKKNCFNHVHGVWGEVFFLLCYDNWMSINFKVIFPPSICRDIYIYSWAMSVHSRGMIEKFFKESFFNWIFQMFPMILTFICAMWMR